MLPSAPTLPSRMTVDGNEAVASVAYRMSEVIAIYPITPASAMGELSDEWSSKGVKNLWQGIPEVIEMQSEAGAAGAVHGALQAGALATTFTASQGLLLMIPNLYKIAGELTPFCLHVAARTLATHALSIFGDHSDVMACRQTGMAMLCSGSVQEAQDFAAISHAVTLKARIPFLHFFDGFRTSHEINTITPLSDDILRGMLDEEDIAAHRARALSPDHPVIRGTAQNPDAFFQAREACNRYYDACPEKVEQAFERFAALTGRQYHLFEYHGDPEAEDVIIMMGSGAEAVHETVDVLRAQGRKVGLLRVRLFRPFQINAFVQLLPSTVKRIAVLDRTKEPGAVGEPLFQDVITALYQSLQEPDNGSQKAHLSTMPMVIGGRYGLSSKEFTPAMAKAVFDELRGAHPKRHFTVGIVDDITHLSLPFDESFKIHPKGRVEAMFYGLGADGTVGSNKNTIKIIGEETGLQAQGYFVYDSKKSGAITISHLRFGPDPIRSTYRITEADFIACHQFGFLDKYEMLAQARDGAIFLLNSPIGPDRVWESLPREVQQIIIGKRLKFYVMDAWRVAQETGMGQHISTAMQAAFFALSGVLPREQAIGRIKKAIEKSYGKKGVEVVRRNFAAVDQALDHLYEVNIPAEVTTQRTRPALIASGAPDFVQRVTAVMMANQGDLLPVSAFPVDGTWPSGTSRWEKRAIAQQIPQWDKDFCIQCNKCAFVCPHAAIRTQAYPSQLLEVRPAPTEFQHMNYKGTEFPDHQYTVQVAPEDCTGCGLCVQVCPGRDKANPRHKSLNLVALAERRSVERESYNYFLELPHPDRTQVKSDIKGTQFLEPLFEYSGACAGCGETPYLKLLSQLYGDRAVIANATGCSSIYSGNLPTTPYTMNAAGQGPAWANSLFEDNAEFGLGIRLGVDAHAQQARALVQQLAPLLAPALGEALLTALIGPEAIDEAGIQAQRERVARLKVWLKSPSSAERGMGERGDNVLTDPTTVFAMARLLTIADYLVHKSVWLVGGDGWAYDIGYGGLDHVLASHRKVNVLVLDTEVYSNTGGQQSKATPLGAAARFASNGKSVPKKDLGLLAMSYGHVYVARVAFGAKDAQTVKAFQEAEAHPGPSLIIAYSHCIAHGYDLVKGLDQQKLAVDSGIWPLYRFDPRRLLEGEAPLSLDVVPGKASVREYMRNEMRFVMVEKSDPKRFAQLMQAAEDNARRQVALYEQLSHLQLPRAQKADG